MEKGNTGWEQLSVKTAIQQFISLMMKKLRYCMVNATIAVQKRIVKKAIINNILNNTCNKGV